MQTPSTHIQASLPPHHLHECMGYMCVRSAKCSILHTLLFLTCKQIVMHASFPLSSPHTWTLCPDPEDGNQGLLFPSFSLSFSRRDRDSLTPSLFSASAVRPPVRGMSCRWEEADTSDADLGTRGDADAVTGTSGGRGAQQATHRVQQVHSL